MTIEERQNALLEEFGVLEDWLDRYQQIIDLGQGLPEAPERLRQDENLIKGCQSRVWIGCEIEDGILHFAADSDAVITKGIAALLIEILDGQTPEAIADAEIFLIEKLGLKEHLSPTRANGLVAMVDRMRDFAKQHCAPKN